MILGIDASNIKAGGGLTHLSELLKSANPNMSGFNRIIVWSGKNTLKRFCERSWLEKQYLPILDNGLVFRALWQKFELSKLARANNCDVLFVPGGSFAGNFKPVVAFSQNLLPFDWQELRRFGLSWLTIKMLLLRKTQSDTFRSATGVIYLTSHAKKQVEKVISGTQGKTIIIPHGINERFRSKPKKIKEIEEYGEGNPFRIIYVSSVEIYKHQWNVVKAVAMLRESGMPVSLDLIGPGSQKVLAKLRQEMNRVDPNEKFIHYRGAISFDNLHSEYIEADLSVFASSCENMPNILLESMASGLPIACSDRGPMPEILKTAGVYFDPENPSGMANELKMFIKSKTLREEKAHLAFKLSQKYCWELCANQTFGFFKEIARAEKS